MKIAGLKGRSPETYPSPRANGLVATDSAPPNPDPVTLSISPTPLVGIFSVLPGNKVSVMYSGVVSESGGSVLVDVSVVLDDGSSLYTKSIEVTGNGPTPFSLVYETPVLAATPDPHEITLLASTSSGTATIAANGSVVLISTPS